METTTVFLVCMKEGDTLPGLEARSPPACAVMLTGMWFVLSDRSRRS